MRTRRLPSPAMIVACLALFLALGGTGYAAGHLTAGGKDRVSRAKDQAKRGPRGKRGLRGPQGLPGPVGPLGPVGPAGPRGAEALGLLDYEEGEPAPNPAETTTFLEADCPPGLSAIGGGVRTSSADERQVVASSYPGTFAGNGDRFPNRWQARVTNLSKDALSATAFVICARAAAFSGNFEPEV